MHYDSRYPRHSGPEGRRYGRDPHLDDRTGVGPGSPGGYEPGEHRARNPERGRGGRRFARGYAEDQSFDPPQGQIAEFGDEDYDYEREPMDRDERRGRERYYRGADFGGGRPRAADMRDNDYRRAMEDSGDRAGRYQAYPFNPYDAWWGVGPGFGFGRDLSDGRGREEHIRRGRERDHDRGFWDKASDEVASWFGDDEAEHRRDMDRGEHAGRGPKGYKRSDDRICEDVCDRLAQDSWLDASGIEVKAEDCEVTLDGNVESRSDKRRAELWAETVMGVDHVQNNLRVDRNLAWSSRPSYDESVGESAVSPVGEYATISKQTRGNA